MTATSSAPVQLSSHAASTGTACCRPEHCDQPVAVTLACQKGHVCIPVALPAEHALVRLHVPGDCSVLYACRQMEDELDQRTSELIQLRKAAVEQVRH